jgi:hypothetical protein
LQGNAGGTVLAHPTAISLQDPRLLVVGEDEVKQR